MHEECGICGISKDNAQEELYKMLIQMQHRGQVSAGITVFKKNQDFLLKTYKDLGLVSRVFKSEHKEKFTTLMNQLSSNKGIGHVRYSTCGVDKREYAQPFEHFHGKKNRWFSISFNGNIANYDELKTKLENENYHFVRKTDTELILLLLAKLIKKGKTLVESFRELSEIIDGAYNIAVIDAEGTIACFRDKLGLKPLSYSYEEGNFAFASESVALQSIGFKEIKDLPPGKIAIFKNDKLEILEVNKSEKKAHCFFEWIYFAHAASKMDGQIVYNARYALGEELAKTETENLCDAIVVPVPDSSTPCGSGFARKLNLPVFEGLIRNRYLGRTFIESNGRGEKVKAKFTVIKEIFEGKKVFLIEDSIVRGTTLKNLIEYIKKANPKEIHVRVSSPPIISPCYYGIDMSAKKELIAVNKTEKDIAKEIGATTVKYQTIKGLTNALNASNGDLCLACINGEYPTPAGERRIKNDKN
jgi:amidophosphoribosyltransferase